MNKTEKSSSKKPDSAQTTANRKNITKDAGDGADSKAVKNNKIAFGAQLRKWRLRAGLTAVEAGMRAFGVKHGNSIESASAKKKWERYERGEIRGLDDEKKTRKSCAAGDDHHEQGEIRESESGKKIRKLCAAVGGHPRLGAAILAKNFIGWKKSEHRRHAESIERELFDYYEEDGFEDQIEEHITENKNENASDKDPDFYWEPYESPKKINKSKAQKATESDEVTKEFLINRRRKHEFTKGPSADAFEHAPSGTSIEYMINMQKYETDEDPEVERNLLIERFFKNLLYFDEDLSFTALQDLWLSFLFRNNAGYKTLQKTIEFYGGNGISFANPGQRFVYKYAAHYATILLLRLYALAYDPLDPKTSEDELEGESLKNYKYVRKLAELLKKLREAVEEDEKYQKLSIELYETSFKILPRNIRTQLKKDFSRVVSALASEDTAPEYLKIEHRAAELVERRFLVPEGSKSDFLERRVKRRKMKNDFKFMAMSCFSRLYYLEKEIYYPLSEDEQVAFKKEQERFFNQSIMREKHTLFRFYDSVMPQQFIESLWLLQDTFDLYNIKSKELADEKKDSEKL